jgi:uncharacterized LabA/DUF88 family protein
MSFYPTERVAILIDGANFHSTTRALGLNPDYKKLLAFFQDKARVVRAYYFTAITEDESGYSSLQPLVDWLAYNGFTTVTKVVREYTDASGPRRTRMSIDVDLAVCAMRISDTVEHIVLFSGSGEFRPLVNAIQAKGVRVTVVSTIKTQPASVSDEMRRQADVFIDVADIADGISRPIPAKEAAE